MREAEEAREAAAGFAITHNQRPPVGIRRRDGEGVMRVLYERRRQSELWADGSGIVAYQHLQWWEEVQWERSMAGKRPREKERRSQEETARLPPDCPKAR
ncbi:hypothetical protein HPP92_029150 [Vanilla planifolia]|uniref:Uncharacterized protein n=1 Tax=Vanilla planifolia TaxID=51239 RepID=A0A835P4R7_VANPL|nr:hypothetical protein HPP92_029150 [Vanilla planifolia]KAG0445828.1 hypothetical protein HPP92_029139 [Vanilla planifolia]